jgi:hypothetical protein
MPHMLSSSPATSAPVRRLVLLPAESRTGRSDAAVRRYRLARLRLDGRDVPSAGRRAHARHSLD